MKAIQQSLSLSVIDLFHSLVGTVKRIVHKAFWDHLESELNEDPPEYEHAIKLFEEIKEVTSFSLPLQYCFCSLGLRASYFTEGYVNLQKSQHLHVPTSKKKLIIQNYSSNRCLNRSVLTVNMATHMVVCPISFCCRVVSCKSALFSKLCTSTSLFGYILSSFRDQECKCDCTCPNRFPCDQCKKEHKNLQSSHNTKSSKNGEAALQSEHLLT